MIDLTIKKKKKKKKNFDLEAALGEGHDEGEPMDISTAPDKENQEPSANNEDFDGNSAWLVTSFLFSFFI